MATRIPRIWLFPYGVAAVSVIASVLVSLLLWPLVVRYPYMFFWPAVIVSTWYGGLKSGLLSVLLTALITILVFQTRYVLPRPDLLDVTALLLFVLLASLASWIVSRNKSRGSSLRQNEQRFRMMVDSVPGCVWTARPDGSIDFANRYWQEFTGLTLQQTAGLEWSSALHPDDVTHTLDVWLKAAKEATPYELTARNRRADGEWRWLLNRAVPVCDERGSVIGWYGTSMDVTELKETRDALARERDILQKLVDTIPVMITIYHPDTRILKLNPEFERMTGWTTEAAAGVSLMEEIYPDPAYREEIRKYMSSLEPGWRDIEMTTRDGRVIQTSWANIRFVDNTQVGIGINITARKRAEERTRTLQQITANLGQAMTLAEVANIIVHQGIKMVGAAAGNLMVLTDNDTMLEIVNPVGYPADTVEAWRRLPVDTPATPITDCVRTKQPIWLTSLADRLEQYPVNPDIPGVSEYEARANIPLVVNNRALGVLGFAFAAPQTFDEEDRHLMMILAQQCAQTLERVRLHEQARALATEEERKRLARDLHDAVSQTLYSATVVAESLPRIWRREPQRALPLLEQLLSMNKAAMAEMRTLLWELRPEALEKASLQELCTQLANAIRGRKQMQITLDFQVDYDAPLPPSVHVTFYRIAQEALNNVAKHAQAKHAAIRLISTPELVELRVSDDGKGFDPRQSASGMGMGTMRERADSIQAAFAITSTPGSGTQVSVRWPRQSEAARGTASAMGNE